MSVRRVLASAAAAALMTAPLAAQAIERVPARTQAAEGMVGEKRLSVLLPLAAFLALALFVVLEGSDDDEPVSP